MIVSVGIIALNEQDNIGDLFENLIDQTYSKKLTELVLVDSGSSDETKIMMLNFMNENIDKYYSIKVLDNKGKIQASGWNVVINNSVGDVIIRVDAHAILTEKFIENNVKCIKTGEDVCGGQRINVIKGDSLKAKALLEAENSMFGSGIAAYRRSSNSEKKYVNTVAHACYKKEVFKKVGLFDEMLLRSEDNDMHYRIRENGYKICYDSEIVSYYQSRNTIKASLKQKYANGEWVGITSIRKTPKMFSLYHFIPALFVLAIIIAAILSAISPIFSNILRLIFNIPTVMIWGLYLILLFLMLLSTTFKTKNLAVGIYSTCLVVLFHISYGVGIIYGLLKSKIGRKLKNEKN